MAAWRLVTMARRSAAVLHGGVKVIPCHEAACSRDKRNYVASILAGWRAVENRCYVKKITNDVSFFTYYVRFFT